ncbi:MAG: hypothetical protein IJK18_08655 [Clostridia bacterium]|nr:hypothetical protein [Clostridia bacterium]
MNLSGYNVVYYWNIYNVILSKDTTYKTILTNGTKKIESAYIDGQLLLPES